MAVVVVVTALLAASPSLAQTTGSGPTEAPDLVSVGNFRPGPDTDDGTPQTLVDYTFDQMAYLNGGDRSSFHLAPLDAGDALDARGVEPAADIEGDEVITVLYNGTLTPADYARGYVDTGVANSDPNNVSNENPANINQSEDLTPNTKTENPDLVRVRRGGESSYLFQFDEPLTDDDVVQSNSGLRIYFPETDQNSTIPSAGAIRVEEVNDTTLRAIYSEDLPEGYTLSDAVGAFVRQGTVQSAQGSRGGNDGKNAFDEVLLETTCTIEGTSGDDVLTGTPGADVICGLGGNDEIRGAGGDDEIRGGAGDDTIGGGSDQDLLYGGAGTDTIYGGTENDTLRGNTGEDKLVGGEGNDKLVGGDDVDRLFGQEDSDRIYGQAGDDILRGGPGQDRLVGGDNDDNIGGGEDNDDLFGQKGEDVLRGDAGDDLLRGGANSDNLKDTEGADRLRGEGGDDFLDAKDNRGGDLVDGGGGRNGCRADGGDTVRNCV